MRKINYFLIAPWLRAEVKAYIEQGKPFIKNFLRVLFERDMCAVEDYLAADYLPSEELCLLIEFLNSEAPVGSMGDKRAVDNWVAHKGLRGLKENE